MRYKTHLVGGLLLGCVTASKVTGDSASMVKAVFIAGSVAGSLFPDIDHKGSYLGRRARIASTITSSVFGHRGAFHSPFFIGGLTFLLYMLSRLFVVSSLIKYIFIGFYVGNLSHIFLDMLTVSGVPIFYPLSKKKVSLVGVKTGGTGELVVFTLMVGALVYLGYTEIVL